MKPVRKPLLSFLSNHRGLSLPAILLACLVFTFCGKDDSDGIFGSYVDPEDGKVYRTIQIGAQTWLADNIDRGEMVPGISEQEDNGIVEKYCYDDNYDNCREYGGLYQWGEAMQYEVNESLRGICPAGFRVPTDGDWKELEMFLGFSSESADQTLWRGTDQGDLLKESGETGFDALFAGNRYLTGTFNKIGERTFFWTSTKYSDGHAWGRAVDLYEKRIYRAYYNKSYGFSVRCVKE